MSYTSRYSERRMLLPMVSPIDVGYESNGDL